MTSKIISQNTFDDVLKENIVEFLMSPEEAREETIKQFEAQGVNLANIIKDLSINPTTGEPILIECLGILQNYVKNGKNGNNSLNQKQVMEEQQEIIIKSLKELKSECEKSVPHRVLAAKHQAHEILLELLQQQLAVKLNFCKQFIIVILETINKLYHKQPDIFNAEVLAIMLQLLDENLTILSNGLNQNEKNKQSVLVVESEQVTIICLCLQLLQKASFMHEMNRQNIMAADIVKYLKKCIDLSTKFEAIQILRESIGLCRALVLDDDIRVEFGCAHEHARQLAAAFVVNLTELLKLKVFQKDTTFLSDLFMTICLLAVRQEICKTIYDSGGVELIFGTLNLHLDSARLNLEALKLLRALAGNDDVKNAIVNAGIAPILKNILQLHLNNDRVVSAALACISTLTLRMKENSRILFDCDIAETIVESMRLHSKVKNVQRNGAWAIRNMVSRSREQCPTWLSLGIEQILNDAFVEHPSVQQDIKIALRDLGCKVELREEWTGVAEKKIID